MIEIGDRRYNEPKHIGDIIKDIKMDPENIERQMKIKLSSKKFAEETMQTLQRYADTMDNLIPLYAETSKLIMDIDHYYTEEKASLGRAKLSVKEGIMNQRDINERIRAIEKKLTVFEIDQGDVRDSLRKNINKFSSPKDRMEHTKKTNAFCDLYMKIYCEIDDFCMEYERLLRKAKR